RSRAVLRMHSVGELISDRPLMLDPDTRVAQARRAMADANTSQACLVDSQGFYKGTLQLHQLIDAADGEPARRWRDKKAMIMRDDETVWDAMHALREFVGEAVAVVNEDGRLVGIVYESDLITAYLDLLEGMRREEHATG
ncbi:MAG TPA: CBS domain-containing protein, partial [Wenzhouxiangella sp.]|nr:CBS domain-containing protein [Wenzhouxiangella sp.]